VLQCFSHSLEWGDSSQRWCCLCRKTVRSRQNSFKEQNEFTVLTMFLDPLFSNIKDSLTNMQFFSHSLVCSCYAQRWCSSPMETLRGRAYCLKQHTQFSNLNMLLNHLASNIICFLRKATVFLHSLERGCFAQSWYASPLKTLTVRKGSFQMRTRFTMHNKVKGPLACNTNASLTELQWFSPSLEWGHSARKVMLLIQENTERYAVLLERANWIHNINQVARLSCF
jgi:hypothetical protein